jgi:hypothetical protein
VIPSLAEFLENHRRFVVLRDLSRRRDESRIAESLAEATELCAGHPEDEPAAMLFAFSKRARAIADAWNLPVLYARNLARAQGLMLLLEFDDIELIALRLRVATNRATFEDMRAFVAARLRPMP